MVYSFAGCVLDVGRHVLSRDGRPVPIEPQVFDLLKCLAENAGTLVTKDQLVEAVWNGRIVSEATISGRINAARAAVGDTGRAQKIIRTVPRRGFEMVAEVSNDAPTEPKRHAVRQTVRYAASKDGTNIAWSEAGSGAPVLYAWHHLSHLEQDWESALLGPGLRQLADRHRLIRFDIRGSGLSDPIRADHTLDSHVEDMEAVVNAAGLDRFPIVAFLQAAAVAIRFAARYPERVSRLVLVNSYARGRALRENAPPQSENDPFIALLNSGGWGDPANGFMRAWATMVLPMATNDETTEFISLIAHSGSTEEALLQRALIDSLDVRDDLGRVAAKTLVIHARLCTIHPAAEGRRVAAGIADAEFLEVDSSNTFPMTSDPSFDRVQRAMLEFLARDGAGADG